MEYAITWFNTVQTVKINCKVYAFQGESSHDFYDLNNWSAHVKLILTIFDYILMTTFQSLISLPMMQKYGNIAHVFFPHLLCREVERYVLFVKTPCFGSVNSIYSF